MPAGVLFFHFGERVGVFPELDVVVRGEVEGSGITGGLVRDLEPVVVECLEAGRLVGVALEAKEDWLRHRAKVHANFEEDRRGLQEAWIGDAAFRAELVRAIEGFFSPFGIEHSDDGLGRYFKELEHPQNLGAVKKVEGVSVLLDVRASGGSSTSG